MEKYQGRHGRIEVPELEEKDTYSKDPVIVLQKHLDWIEKARYDIVPKTDTALHNIIDEIVGQYLETIYLLSLI